MSLPEINHTQVSNYFIDKILPNVSPSATICFLIITRKTVGWHKKTDRISLSQFEKLTNLTKNTIKKSIKELLEKNIITSKREGVGRAIKTFFEINYIEIMDNKKLNKPEIDNGNGSNLHPINGDIVSIFDPISDFNGSKIDPTNKSKYKEKNIKKETAPYSIAIYLFDKIMLNAAPPIYKNRQPNFSKWSGDIEKLHRLDGIDYVLVLNIIDFATQHNFWKNVVLSGEKLRSHFNRLYLEMEKENNGTKEKKQQELSNYIKKYKEDRSGRDENN